MWKFPQNSQMYLMNNSGMCVRFFQFQYIEALTEKKINKTAKLLRKLMKNHREPLVFTSIFALSLFFFRTGEMPYFGTVILKKFQSIIT